MNNKTELKKSISDSFKEDNYSFAFEHLLLLPHHEVTTLLSKNRWLQDTKIREFFWCNFCIRNHELVFDSVANETFINWCLVEPGSTDEELDKLLVSNYPAAFVKGIKRNRSFLDEHFLTQLKNLPWDPEHSVDVLAWHELYKTFAARQANIENAWRSLQNHSPEFILSGIIHWIDVRYYQDYSDVNHERLRWVYNYAVNYIFSKKQFNAEISEEKFDDVFFNTIHSSQLDGVDVFLNTIDEWITFETTILSSYCFDDNFQVSMKEGVLHFDFISEDSYEEWKKDTERYLVNAKRYFVDALQIYDYQDKAGELNIPAGGSEINEKINHGLYIKNWQSALFLGDLQLNNLQFKGKSVHCSKFLGGLMSYSVNRQWRYNEHMREYSLLGYDWNHSLLYTMQAAQKEGVGNNPVPYIYEATDVFIKLYKHAIPELEEGEIEDLINHFAYTLKPGREINPFQIGYSVMETPFLRIGKYLLAPTSLFASNDWFYSIAQRILYLYANKHHVQERNSSAAQMEQELGDRFKEQGWKVKVISTQEANKIDGDIDLFINDGFTQLLIQLKRTKFKLDLASNYKDELETDLKASGQLNEAVNSLDSNPLPGMTVFEKHEKWIVTTSFEGVLSKVDGCLKVNYFDLLWALRNKKFDSLDELKTYMEGDGPFLDCRPYLELLD